MIHTDKQLQLATEIAYFDFHKALKHSKGFSNISIIDNIDLFLVLDDTWLNLSNKDIERLKVLQEELMKNDCHDWKIIDFIDDNNKNQSGFYGIVIDTGDGLIVSFRGSEDITDPQHVKQDWVNADLALMNNTLTEQQRVVNEWLKEINESDYIKNADYIVFTGHSLGGNLAFHATIMSTYYENIFSRLKQSVNFDGPGFSREYFEEYDKQIEQVIQLLKENFRHYQWSVVGSLLEPVPGSHYMTVETKIKDGWIDRITDYLIMEHSTENLVFDRNGNVKEGKMSKYEMIIGKYSEYLDRLPAFYGNLIVSAIAGILVVATWENKYLKMAVIGAVGILAVVVIAKLGFTVTLALLGRFIAWTAATLIIGATREILFELIEEISVGVVNLLSKTYQWTKNQIAQLTAFIQEEIAKLKNWLKNLMESKGFAVATPLIEVNTYKLREYAERLERVRIRIRNLDTDMNRLYFTRGYLDLLDIIRANRLPSSWQIKRCIAYLEETADAFDKAERKILAQI